jgi:NAD(P)-dependent dehydrogenase (short-subunit alcohol dehydrogenase family)
MIDNLDGAAAVIVGGGSGIGRGTALALAEVGVHVLVGDIDAERASAVAREASKVGADAVGVKLDVNEPDDFAAARDAADASFGRIDIVMNNVGVLSFGLPEHLPFSEWQRIVDTNLFSLVRSNEVFLPVLLEQGHGHIVNTASTAGLFAYAYERLPYTATKAAVVAISEALALYTVPRGVGVTCLCPGPVATNIAEQMTFSGPDVRIHGPGDHLEVLTAEQVGVQVREAIVEGRFLLLTHPELHETLLERAQDPEAFLQRQVRSIVEQDK